MRADASSQDRIYADGGWTAVDADAPPNRGRDGGKFGAIVFLTTRLGPVAEKWVPSVTSGGVACAEVGF